MKRFLVILTLLSTVTLLFINAAAFADEAVVGEAAPDFTATDTNNQAHSLSGYQGKIVVLEWFNHGCPFVKKYYNSKKMQGLQKAYTNKGVIWLSICSSAPGKQGYQTVEQANLTVTEKKIAATGIILDSEGEIGKKYGAKTTPHMFVIDTQGVLVYNGAIDDKPSTKQNDLETAHNYVKAALEEIMAEKAVTAATSVPYGCSVKYKN